MIADSDPDCAKSIPSAIEVVSDYMDAIRHPDVDVIHVCLPHHMHKPAVIAAAEAGKAIICEKPMALDAAEGREIADAIAANDARFSLISQNRLNAEKAWLKSKIESGEMGEILTVEADVDWFRDREYYAASGGWRGRDVHARGGVLTNQAYHTLDLVIWLLQEMPTTAIGNSSTDLELHPEIDVPDVVTSELSFASGTLCRFHSTTCGDPKDVIRLVVDGAGNGDGPVSVVLGGGSVLASSLPGGVPNFAPGGPNLGKSAYGGSHQANIALSYQAFAEGKHGPVTAEDGIRALAVIDAMLTSDGDPVEVV